jgi:hypothetical protein
VAASTASVYAALAELLETGQLLPPEARVMVTARLGTATARWASSMRCRLSEIADGRGEPPVGRNARLDGADDVLGLSS